jgi:porphyrinogen peroxidase
MGSFRPHESQRLDAPLTTHATFLTLSINKDSSLEDSLSTVRDTLSSLTSLCKNVAIRDASAHFSVTVGIAASVWSELTNLPLPKELHAFKSIKGQTHTAPSTDGDLFLHVRSERRDLNFEFERQVLSSFASSIKVIDSTSGFRYFDVRDLLGFVDGTANPIGSAINDSVLITDSDDTHGAGGSYIVTQKYLHDLDKWNGLSTDLQEKIIGRTKLNNEELPDASDSEQKPHKQLATIEKDGVEYDIIRDNMPFGNPGQGEFGTYFIGYSRRLWVVEEMLERMFVGVPEGKHDRILDVSRAVSGNVWFAPGMEVLRGMGG